MSLIVRSSAAPASHRGRHRRKHSNGVSFVLGVLAVAAAALLTFPAIGFALTVLGMP